ncbi:hypothetical protein FDECE_14344 [Fusarium decemcellulare]|nr:hypothetical protein FDECE_14344 [Fusarium decemcellulare]
MRPNLGTNCLHIYVHVAIGRRRVNHDLRDQRIAAVLSCWVSFYLSGLAVHGHWLELVLSHWFDDPVVAEPSKGGLTSTLEINARCSHMTRSRSCRWPAPWKPTGVCIHSADRLWCFDASHIALACKVRMEIWKMATYRAELETWTDRVMPTGAARYTAQVRLWPLPRAPPSGRSG